MASAVPQRDPSRPRTPPAPASCAGTNAQIKAPAIKALSLCPELMPLKLTPSLSDDGTSPSTESLILDLDLVRNPKVFEYLAQIVDQAPGHGLIDRNPQVDPYLQIITRPQLR